MKCTRFIGGKEVEVDLTGLYEGRTAFLVGGSPTLLLQDYRRLASRDILSFGINNAGKVVRCAGYFMGDNPRCFFNSVVHDRSAIRFLNAGYQRYFPKDDENVYFFTRKDGRPSADNVYGPEVVSGNNTLSMAIFMLLSFKVRRIVLCGSTFNAGSYGHGQVLNREETNWNSRLYVQQAGWLAGLSGLFGELGVEFIDTSVVSKVAGTYRTMDLSTALDLYAEKPTGDQKSVMHCRALRLSDGGKVDEKLGATFFDFDKDDIPAVTGVLFPSDEEGRGLWAMWLLLLARSLAESNRGREFRIYADDRTAGDDLFALVMGYVQYWHGGSARVFAVAEETREGIAGDRESYMRNLRLYLPAMADGMAECVWLDCDTVVRQDLSFLAREARMAAGRDVHLAGCPVSEGSSAIDPGVMFMDLTRLHDTNSDAAFHEALSSGGGLCQVANMCGAAKIDGRWNVRPFASPVSSPVRSEGYAAEQANSAYVLHFKGDKAALPRTTGPAADMLFKYLAGIRTEMRQGDFDRILSFDKDGRWKTRMEEK